MALLSNVLTLLILLIAPDSTQSVAECLPPGSEAPRFWVSNLDGGDFYLSRRVGAKARPNEKSPVVISFFTTACIPCRQEIPYLDSLQMEFPQVAFYIVNVGEEPSLVKKYVQMMKYKLPVLIDRYSQVAKKYEVSTTPTLVGIDIDGRIAFYTRGYRESDEDLIRKKIMKLANVKPARE